jgi:hypothetical protein
MATSPTRVDGSDYIRPRDAPRALVTEHPDLVVAHGELPHVEVAPTDAIREDLDDNLAVSGCGDLDFGEGQRANVAMQERGHGRHDSTSPRSPRCPATPER